MNVLVVDTSAWIAYFKGQPSDDLDLALKEGRVYLPSIVVAELLSGKMKQDMRAKLQSFLKELPVCINDFEHWVRVGELRENLQSEGIAISTPDAHIAQCALDLNGYLLSDDLIFSKISKYIPLRLL